MPSTALLAPAEAAVHVEHPNLLSRRRLLEWGSDDGRFLVFFVADPDDADGAPDAPDADGFDAEVRRRLLG